MPVEVARSGIEIDPDSASVWRNKGLALSNLKKYGKAIKYYNKALELDPNYVDAWNDKGKALYYFGKYDDSIVCYGQALEIDPNNTLAWQNKGDSLLAIGNGFEAEHCYIESINLYLKGIETLSFLDKINIGEICIKIRKHEQGREYLLQALNETQDTVYQCGIRFLMLLSYFLENDSTNGNKEFANFFEFYKNLNKDFKIGEEYWDSKSLIKIISKSNSSLQTKFLLLTLIDLLHGKIKKQKFSIFYIIPSNL